MFCYHVIKGGGVWKIFQGGGLAKRGWGQYFRLGRGADTPEDTMPSIICDALRNLVPFAQFKKRERHPWRSNFTKSNTPWVFFTFFKLYQWYQIAQNIAFSECKPKSSYYFSFGVPCIVPVVVVPSLYCSLKILIIYFIIQNITI